MCNICIADFGQRLVCSYWQIEKWRNRWAMSIKIKPNPRLSSLVL